MINNTSILLKQQSIADYPLGSIKFIHSRLITLGIITDDDVAAAATRIVVYRNGNHETEIFIFFST